MKYKYIVKTGIITGSLGLLVLLYNFVNMFDLVSKCPEDIDIQPCQAYTNWLLTNKIGIALLIIGVVIFIIGIVRWQRKD